VSVSLATTQWVEPIPDLVPRAKTQTITVTNSDPVVMSDVGAGDTAQSIVLDCSGEERATYCFQNRQDRQGPCHQKLSFSMLYRLGHWSLWHGSFPPEL
jgi:hypothetical protein